jgi:hypothetical protein
MRLLAGVLLVAVAVVVVVGLVSKSGTPKASAAVKRVHVRFLFAQDAASGSLKGPDEQHLKLTLRGVRDWVTRFDDRPVRAAQTVDVRDFLDRWHKRFATAPPNAVLSFRTSADAAPRDMVLELRHPHYDASAGTITYDARRLRRHSDNLPGTKYPRKAVIYPIPGEFQAASLFIDDAGDDICYDSEGYRVACYTPDPGGSVGQGGGGGSSGGGGGGVLM